jgi:hypothetical protein
MNQIQKYEPMIRVITYDDQSYYTPESNYVKIKEVMSKSKFVEVEGVLLAVSSVKRIEKDTQDIQVNHLDKPVRDKVESRIQQFTRNIGRNPTENEIRNIINNFSS